MTYPTHNEKGEAAFLPAAPRGREIDVSQATAARRADHRRDTMRPFVNGAPR